MYVSQITVPLSDQQKMRLQMDILPFINTESDCYYIDIYLKCVEIIKF